MLKASKALGLVLLLLVLATAASSIASAQIPSDFAITRPDHMTYNDMGTCNEGETEYNQTTHVGRRCISANTWATILSLNGTTNQSIVFSAGLPTSALIGDLNLVSNTTVGASAQRVCHATYSFAVDGGVQGAITPVSTCLLPINAIINNVAINSTTAVTSLGSATVAIGTTAGSSATSILTATGKASFTLNGFVQSVPVPQTASTWVKMSAAGSVKITVATADLTAGVIEIFVYYIVSPT